MSATIILILGCGLSHGFFSYIYLSPLGTYSTLLRFLGQQTPANSHVSETKTQIFSEDTYNSNQNIPQLLLLTSVLVSSVLEVINVSLFLIVSQHPAE